jgi:hypothetical protein
MDKREIIKILSLSPLYLRVPVKERKQLVIEMLRRYWSSGHKKTPH